MVAAAAAGLGTDEAVSGIRSRLTGSDWVEIVGATVALGLIVGFLANACETCRLVLFNEGSAGLGLRLADVLVQRRLIELQILGDDVVGASHGSGHLVFDICSRNHD